MDALRKQASKLRVKVSKKQQAVRKQLSGSGYERYDYVVIEEVELQRHQQLEKLYRTTRAGREFQKDIGGAAEALTAIGYKHIEAETKLSEDCCSYGTENDSDTMLAKAVAIYGDACKNVEKETEDLNQLLSLQVLEPLRAMITAGPLEDAWHLAQRYSRMRQEAEGQVEGEKNYHLRIGAILSEVETEMVSDKQQKDSAPPVIPTSVTPSQTGSEKTTYFLAEVSFHFSLTLQMSIVQ
ncbi:SH3 domain-containing protein 3 [Linum grandiflorum]